MSVFKRDCLIVLKQDKIVEPEYAYKTFFRNYRYEYEMQREGSSDSPRYLYYSYGSDYEVSSNSQEIYWSVEDRIRYLFLCAYDDTAIYKAIKEVLPELVIEDIPKQRSLTTGNYLEWKEQLELDYKDFIMNDKYIVLSAALTYSNAPFDKLYENSLLNQDAIEAILD